MWKRVVCVPGGCYISQRRPLSRRPRPTTKMTQDAAEGESSQPRRSQRNAAPQPSKSIAIRQPSVLDDACKKQLAKIPIQVIEHTLAAYKPGVQGGDTDADLLQLLRDPPSTMQKHELVTAIFEKLLVNATELAEVIAMVYVYAEKHAMWRSDTEDLSSMDDLIKRLSSGGHLLYSIIPIGAATQATKRRYLKRIRDAWGSDWHERVLEEIPDDSWTTPDNCPRDRLMAIDTNVSNKLTLEDAVQAWKSSIDERCNTDTRRASNSRTRTQRTLFPSDISKANPASAGAATGQNRREKLARVHFRARSDDEDAEDDEDEGEDDEDVIVNQVGSSQRPPKKKKKKKRDPNERGYRASNSARAAQQDEGTQDPQASENEAAGGEQEARQGSARQENPSRPTTVRPLSACQGPVIASDAYQAINRFSLSVIERSSECCEDCAPRVRSIKKSLERIQTSIDHIKSIEEHHSGGEVIQPARGRFEQLPDDNDQADDNGDDNDNDNDNN